MPSQNTEVTNFSPLLGRRGDSLAEAMADAADLSNRMRIISILTTSLCLPVVLLVFAAYIDRSSRKHLDRVSFRLVVLALLCNLVSSITLMSFYVRHDADCLGFMWSLQFFGQLCSNLSLCVGLNLLLVMVWRQDGRKLERWYFIGSILQALIVSLPAVGAKAWGPDPTTGSCGYVFLDPGERRRWRIATVLAWPLIDIIGELVTFTWVLIYMMRSKAFNRTLINSSRNRKSWISNNSSQCTSGARRARKHQMVVLRILLYPLSAALSVILLVCGEIYTNRANPSIKVAKTLIPIGFLVRTVLYSLITILDPSLLRALQTLFNILRGRLTESDLRSSSAPRCTESSGNNHAISIATVTVSVSRSYPNEFELENARVAAAQDDKGIKGDSNDVIPPRTPSPTKASAKFPNSDDARNRDVTLDLPPRMGDVELGTTRVPPGRLGRWGSLADHSRDSARVSEESAEFLKQL
ncbi:hypothetical protein L218DRAFT_297426 [Marasmius fiardii PR-910]|nr:hypothetical protein L218DRAFT_297426 [Marasmius fiardii PR-910]